MPFVVGTDEAGYGPNLGPLCVSASVWEIDDGIDPTALYKQLRRVVANCVDRAGKKRVVWADSKAVYKNCCGMDHLERGVMAALALVDRLPSDWRQLWQGLNSQHVSATAATNCEPSGCRSAFAELPWHVEYSASLPLWMNGPEWMSAEHLAELADCLRAGMAAVGVRLIGLLCRAVFPDEFNDLVSTRNKADALSRVTLGLISDALDLIDSGSVHVFCDKHGGRDRYLPLLQSQFPEDWIEVRQEGSGASVYRFGNEDRPIEIGFHVAGERFLPVALASMTAKYVRETAMRPFNEFWCARIPGLKPTAGYPTDSRRFKQQISAVQRELLIDDHILWRNR
jgi:ribonuclease HII